MSHPTILRLDQDPRFRDLAKDGHRIDLRYNSANNFLGRNLYQGFDRAFLQVDAATKLARAQELLRERSPGHRFVIFDALRPRAIQRVLWSAVVGTPNEPFIANPDKGSLHNFGLAVDLGIEDERGRPLDVGADFDDFRDVAQPRYEEACLARGEITRKQLARRHVLRDVMAHSGFTQLAHEWWHFNSCTLDEAWSRYAIIE